MHWRGFWTEKLISSKRLKFNRLKPPVPQSTVALPAPWAQSATPWEAWVGGGLAKTCPDLE